MSIASVVDFGGRLILNFMLCLQELKAEPAEEHQIVHTKPERSEGPAAQPPQSHQPLSFHQVQTSLAARQPSQGQHAHSQHHGMPAQQQPGLAPQSYQQPQQAHYMYQRLPGGGPKGPPSTNLQGRQPQQQQGRMQEGFPGIANRASAHTPQTDNSTAWPTGPAAAPAWHAGLSDSHPSQAHREACPGPPHYPQEAGGSTVGPVGQHGNVVTSWQGAPAAAHSYPYQQHHQPPHSMQQPAPPYPVAPAMPLQSQPAAGGQPPSAAGLPGFGLSPELLNTLKDLAPTLQQLQQPNR